MKRKWLLLFLPLIAMAGIEIFFLCSRPEPQYCWLVFGPESNVRFLVCLTGEAVSLDQYASWKSTGRKERFKDRSECKGLTISDPDEKTCYFITGMSGTITRTGVPTELFVGVDIKGQLEYHQSCDVVEMGADPSTAPVAHFNGPLTVGAQTIKWKLPPDLALRRGDKPTDLRAIVGTMDAQKGCWVVVSTQENKWQAPFPQGVHPFVDVEFPHKNQIAPPIRERYSLDGFC
jgi:hypothetical protein